MGRPASNTNPVADLIHGMPYVECLVLVQVASPEFDGRSIRSILAFTAGACRLGDPDGGGTGKRRPEFVKTVGDVERCWETECTVAAILSRRGRITACQDSSETHGIALSVLKTGSTRRGRVRAEEPDLCANSL